MQQAHADQGFRLQFIDEDYLRLTIPNHGDMIGVENR